MRRSKRCGNAGSGEVEPISQGLYKTCIESSFKLKTGLASRLWWGVGLHPTPWWHDNLFHTPAVLGASLNGLGWPLVWCSTVPAHSATLSPFDDIFCVISKGSDYLKGDLTVVHISQYISGHPGWKFGNSCLCAWSSGWVELWVEADVLLEVTSLCQQVETDIHCMIQSLWASEMYLGAFCSPCQCCLLFFLIYFSTLFRKQKLFYSFFAFFSGNIYSLLT